MELYDAIDVTLVRCLSTPISRGAEDSSDLQSFLPHNIHCNTTEHLFTFTPDVFYTTPFYQKSMAHDHVISMRQYGPDHVPELMTTERLLRDFSNIKQFGDT